MSNHIALLLKNITKHLHHRKKESIFIFMYYFRYLMNKEF